MEDLIESAICLMNDGEKRPANIGNPQEMSVEEIAKMVMEISASESELLNEPLPREDDPKRSVWTIARATESLGGRSLILTHERLGKSVDWFVQRLDSPPKGTTTGR